MEIAKTYKLFLDDIRSPQEAYSYTRYAPFIDEKWVIVRNYEQFVNMVERNWECYDSFPDMVAFDHDLADEHYGAPTTAIFTEKTGMDCAKWLVDYCIDNELDLPNWICHSMNPAGRDNINLFLNNFIKHKESNG